MVATSNEVVPFVRTPLGLRVLKLPAAAHDLVAFVWKQSMPHGNKRLKKGDVALLVLDQGSQYFADQMQCMWMEMGCVACRLKEDKATYTHLAGQFLIDIKKMQGKLGPWGFGGMYTGGGLPHCPFAIEMRALQSFHQLFESVLMLDGRFVQGAPYTSTPQALAMVPSKSRTYKGLKEHTDNNMYKGIPEVWHIQGGVTLSPAPPGWDRVTVLSSRVPQNDFNARNELEGLCSRSSRCEWGCVGKGPRDMPCPSYIFGGEPMLLSDAKQKSDTELLQWLRKNCSSFIHKLPVPPPTPGEAKRIKKRLIAHICAEVGPAISTFKELRKIFNKGSKGNLRKVMVRGLCGGLATADIYRLRRGIAAGPAETVWNHFLKTWDRQVVLQWVANSGRKRRLRPVAAIQKPTDKASQAKLKRLSKRR